MIVVTGTKRSGTSLWMQILEAAGFPVIGSQFSHGWKESIGEANPEGFYESAFRRGIYYATNPHPRTGRYLHPKKTRDNAVKVFASGVARSDVAFLDRVIVTMRPWREYVQSIRRLYAMEDDYLLHRAPRAGPEAVAAAQKRRPKVPPEVEWWFDNYTLIRDIVTRRYPHHIVAFDTLLENPLQAVAEATAFIGRGDPIAGAMAVKGHLRTQRAPSVSSEHLSEADVQVFDELYDHVLHRRPLPRDLLDRMNEVQRRMRAAFGRAPPSTPPPSTPPPGE